MALTEGQQRCVDTLDRPLVVAAGAGSGKTFTLTKRIVGALQSGYLADIGEVCAITFTKKAAGELKSRLKGELRACGLIGQALKVDEAWVSTIHGMCSRILRAHAIELGIDPSFSVAEGSQVQAYLDQAVDTVLVEAQYGESSRDVDALFNEYPARSAGGFGVSVGGMLAHLVAIAASQPNGADSFVLPGVTLRPQSAVEAVVDVVEGIFALAEAEKPGAKRDSWIAQTAEQLARAHELLEQGAGDPMEALAAISPFKLEKTFGSKGFRAQVDEARCTLGASVMEVRLGAARAHLDTLVRLTRQALSVFNQLKQADGVLDNNDLLVLAARALEEHPNLAACYANKFKLVMVDEFQDTDQMQVDMIKRLAGEGACRLCTVGDAQQSIYRFRGADVSVYRRHLESVRSQWDDSVIELAQNFRSHADVLSFVDAVFERPGMFGGEFMSLAPGRDESRVTAPFRSPHARIVVQHTSRPWTGVPGDEACRIAASRIAKKFAELAEAGHSAGDMVILLGRMTKADVYAQALRDEGLSCVISGGSVFARSAEAHIIRELVRVIANPHETQSLFNVLTSPIFSLSAGDLLDIGRFEGFWKAAGAEELEAGCYPPHLECALRVMGEVRRGSGDAAVSRQVERVAIESGWLSRLEREGAEGLASAGNVYKAIRMIRNAESEGACGPVSVMNRFEDALDGSKEAPGALSVSGGNSVRIMTIHASKGLEFPIVAVAEMKEDGAPSARLLSASVGGKVYLSLDLSRSVEDKGASVSFDSVEAHVLGEVAGEDGYAAAVQEEAGALHRRLALRGYLAAGDEEEAKRLLYVAITRAKEAVIVSSQGRRSKANSLGVPKSAFAGVFEALDPLGSSLGAGTTQVHFGGSLPAEVECVELEAESSDGRDDDDVEAVGPVSQEGAERDSFFVPAPAQRIKDVREAYRPLHAGVFSYSSISEASHKGGLLAQLAEGHVASVDVAQGANLPSSVQGAVSPTAQNAGRSASVLFGAHDGANGQNAADRADALSENGEAAAGGASHAGVPYGLELFGLADEGDAGVFDGGSASFDEDRATDLGTAFHRLAQYAVLAREDGRGSLKFPPADRVQALSRTCNLGLAQQERLARALDRWFTCALAAQMADMPQLAAEVPFFISVPRADAPAVFLEGEIDLLGFDESRMHAHVVDYKTGGSDDETPEELGKKHVLQAACYAYAVLLQGASSVDADFVRVERGRSDDASQPQCVRFHFEADEVPYLQQVIGAAYRQANE